MFFVLVVGGTLQRSHDGQRIQAYAEFFYVSEEPDEVSYAVLRVDYEEGCELYILSFQYFCELLVDAGALTLVVALQGVCVRRFESCYYLSQAAFSQLRNQVLVFYDKICPQICDQALCAADRACAAGRASIAGAVILAGFA